MVRYEIAVFISDYYNCSRGGTIFVLIEKNSRLFFIKQKNQIKSIEKTEVRIQKPDDRGRRSENGSL